MKKKIDNKIATPESIHHPSLQNSKMMPPARRAIDNLIQARLQAASLAIDEEFNVTATLLFKYQNPIVKTNPIALMIIFPKVELGFSSFAKLIEPTIVVTKPSIKKKAPITIVTSLSTFKNLSFYVFS